MYKIVYFDMPGKERHHKYIHKYCNGSTAILFLFDSTNYPSSLTLHSYDTHLFRED